MRQRDAEPVHALRTVRREARVGFANAPGVAHHLGKIETAAARLLLVPLQQPGDIGPRRIPPKRMRGHDGVARLLVDGVGQRQHQPALGRLGPLGADMGQALLVTREALAPSGFDRARRCGFDHLGDAPGFAVGDFGERGLERCGGSRIALTVERHVGESAIGRDRSRLAFGALERRHIGRRSFPHFRRDGFFGDFQLAHKAPPRSIILILTN